MQSDKTMDANALPAGLANGWRHPQVVFFHVFFKLAGLLGYIFCTVFSSSFIINFIVITLLIALDFWTVKNVSGRFLVGLRWWNEVCNYVFEWPYPPTHYPFTFIRYSLSLSFFPFFFSFFSFHPSPSCVHVYTFLVLNVVHVSTTIFIIMLNLFSY